MTNKDIKYYYDINQNTDEWLTIKLGVLSASTFKEVITPEKLELSKAAKVNLFYDDLLSQRITMHIERGFTSFDMQRGHDDEPYAVDQYQDQYDAEVIHCGFVINRALGFPLGYSPDGLVGEDGLIEIKSKIPKHQMKTILDHVCNRTDQIIPAEHMMQIQAGLYITGRKWCDFISFSNGMMMVTIRVEPDPEYQEAIEKAAICFEQILQDNMKKYKEAVANNPQLTLTERREINDGEISL